MRMYGHRVPRITAENITQGSILIIQNENGLTTRPLLTTGGFCGGVVVDTARVDKSHFHVLFLKRWTDNSGWKVKAKGPRDIRK